MMKILPHLIPGAPDMRLGIESRALWHPRHAQPRLGHAAALFVIAGQRFLCDRMQHNVNPQCRCYCIDRDVIMRRADAASGERMNHCASAAY